MKRPVRTISVEEPVHPRFLHSYATCLAPKLRPADVAEIQAAHNTTDIEATLQDTFERSALLRTIWLDGFLHGAFGVAPVAPYVGALWLVGSERLRTVPKTLTRQGRRYVREFLQDYPILFNYVDARNTAALRWIEALGGRFLKDIPSLGQPGVPFKLFVITQETVACV